MNTRLQQFLGAENLSQSQFADEIGVARASVSHILAGRNKPGYEFLTGIMMRYPNLNMEWLLLGKGRMYKDARPALQDPVAPQAAVPAVTPAAEPEDAPADLFSTARESHISPETSLPQVEKPATPPSEPLPDVAQSADNQRKISKIIVFYDDYSFQEIL